ncbi:MAG: hypothetical protein IIX64_00020 [Bacteroidales bacterium]|nr:hypothetical protein [Bacteroidales bacterium]
MMETQDNYHSFCLECGDEISYGKRSDSKFCCDRCRCRWHNRHMQGKRRQKEKAERIMEKNHQILIDLLEKGENSIDLLQIKNQGFRPEYASTVLKGRTSMTMSCYNISYKMTEQKIFGIKKEE